MSHLSSIYQWLICPPGENGVLWLQCFCCFYGHCAEWCFCSFHVAHALAAANEIKKIIRYQLFGFRLNLGLRAMTLRFRITVQQLDNI